MKRLRSAHVWDNQKNRVFATNSNFPILIPLQPNSLNLRFFKLGLFVLTEFIVWNIKGLRHKLADI